MPDGPRYDDDFYAWTKYQAEVLRSLETEDRKLDRENLAEEIESLGVMERVEVRAQVRRILGRFLLLRHSAAEGERRYRWKYDIADARCTLDDKSGPTLWDDLHRTLSSIYDTARELAELTLLERDETSAAAALSRSCPYTLDDILRDEWYPEPPQ